MQEQNRTPQRLRGRLVAGMLVAIFVVCVNLGLPTCGRSDDIKTSAAPPAARGAPAQPKVAVPGDKTPPIILEPADPKVAADDGFVTITAKTEGKEVRWLILSQGKVKYAIVGPMAVVSVPAPGAQVYVYAWTAVNGSPTDAARTVITVSGRSPTPPGPPMPRPPAPPNIAPPPSVMRGPLYVIIVDDGRQRGAYPHMAGIVQSAGLRQSVSKAGHTLKIIDASDKGLDTKGFRKFLPGTGGPGLLIVDRAGTVKSYPCPRTPNEIIGIINKIVRETTP